MALKEVLTALQNSKNVLIFTHIAPDGDAIGSAFALSNALKKMGKNSYCVFGKDFSKKYSFLKGDYIINKCHFDADTIISVDCGDKKRISGVELINQDITINIDHHITNDFFAKINYVCKNAAATGEVIYEIIKALEVTIDKDIAECLYCAIVSDTGGFRFANTTQKTHLISAELINCGINQADINRQIFEMNSINKLMVMAKVIEGIELICGGKAAVSYLSKDIFDKYFLEEADIDGFTSIPRSIEGVYIGAFIRQKSDSEIKVGLRSNGNYDVSQIAMKFGGGGHKNASGFTYSKSLDELKNELFPIITDFVSKEA